MQQGPFPPLIEESGGGSGPVLAGWLLIACGLLDLVLACFFAFVRPLGAPAARKVLPAALALGALTMFGVGIALLLARRG